MKEIIEKMNEIKEILKSHNEIISLTVKNICENDEAYILVNGFNCVPAGEVNYKKMSENVGGYQKSIEENGVKILAYGTAEMVVNELKGETK